ALSIIEKSYMLPNQRQRKDLFPEIIFFEAHIVELRKIVKQIQNNDWPGTYKPYISDTLLKAIRMSNENSNEDKNDDEYDEWNFYQ
ncbi:6769_t:CDS:2, partial [Gigaspora rosea]